MARTGITLRCNKCKRENYICKKNQKKHQEKLHLKKYCKFCKNHTEHNEKRK